MKKFEMFDIETDYQHAKERVSDIVKAIKSQMVDQENNVRCESVNESIETLTEILEKYYLPRITVMEIYLFASKFHKWPPAMRKEPTNIDLYLTKEEYPALDKERRKILACIKVLEECIEKRKGEMVEAQELEMPHTLKLMESHQKYDQESLKVWREIYAKLGVWT